MPTELSYSHIDFRLNGERVVGYTDDGDPVEFDNITLAEIRRGKDGTMYTMGTGARGGKVTVRLLPTSLTAKSWLRKHAEILGGARLEWSGEYADSQQGWGVVLAGGVLTEAPPATTPDATLEFVFEFEEIKPNFDAAKFAPSPPPVNG